MALDIVLRAGKFHKHLLSMFSWERSGYYHTMKFLSFRWKNLCPSYSLPIAGEKTARNPWFGSYAQALPLQRSLNNISIP